MKVRELKKFLEATDDEARVLIAEEIPHKHGWMELPITTVANRVEDESPGFIKIIFRPGGDEHERL